VVAVLAGGQRPVRVTKRKKENNQLEVDVVMVARGGGSARQHPMRKYKISKKENNQPEVAVMAAATHGGC